MATVKNHLKASENRKAKAKAKKLDKSFQYNTSFLTMKTLSIFVLLKNIVNCGVLPGNGCGSQSAFIIRRTPSDKPAPCTVITDKQAYSDIILNDDNVAGK